MSRVTLQELLDLVARIGEARRRWKISARTQVARDLSLRLRSSFRTHDRFGTQRFSPGDSARSLVLRDLLVRGQWNVRTYHVLAEAFVRVVLDCSHGLLDHPQTGPFARKLAFALATLGVLARQPSALALLRPRPLATPSFTNREQLGAAAEILTQLQPDSLRPALVPHLLEKALGRVRANTNLFLLLRTGYPLPVLGALLDLLQGRTTTTVVFSVVSEDEFSDEPGLLIEPDSGQVVDRPTNRVERLCEYLDDCQRLGRSRGVLFQPLVVSDQRADLETLLPWLGRLG